jgi:hypothetical protein
MSGCVCVRAEGEEGEEGPEGEEEEENTSDRVWSSREGGAGEDIRWADVVVQGGGAPARRLVIH